MAIESATEVAHSDAAATTGAGQWRDLALVAAVTLAHGPLLLLFFQELWKRPHYQFFPVALGGVGYLIWQRWPRPAPAESGQANRLGWSLLSGGLLLQIGAIVIWYPWLAGPAAIVSAGALLLLAAGRQSLRDFLGPWAVLWMIVPPPMGWDQEVVVGLQRLTARASSLILDVFGINHFMEGTILEFPGRRLLVEEACSGVQSLFALLACTALLLAWLRRPPLQAACMLLAAAFWAATANVMRVVTIALADVFWGIDLTTGWQHELLGFVLFGLALGLVMSTDAVVFFLLTPIGLKHRAAQLNWLSRLWNQVVSLGQTPPSSQPQREASVAAEQVETAVAVAGPARWSALDIGPTRLSACAALAGVLLLLQIVVLTNYRATERSDLVQGLVQRLNERAVSGFMPDSVGEWRVANFEQVQRPERTIFGDFSSTWTYARESGKAIVSIDYPFGQPVAWAGWHELTICYRGDGWQVTRREEIAADPSNRYATPRVEVDMSKATGERAFLVFGLDDALGQPLAGKPTVVGRILDKMRHSRIARSLRIVTVIPPSETSFQTQVLIVGSESADQLQRERARDLFQEARKRLLAVIGQ